MFHILCKIILRMTADKIAAVVEKSRFSCKCMEFSSEKLLSFILTVQRRITRCIFKKKMNLSKDHSGTIIVTLYSAKN